MDGCEGGSSWQLANAVCIWSDDANPFLWRQILYNSHLAAPNIAYPGLAMQKGPPAWKREFLLGGATGWNLGLSSSFYAQNKFLAAFVVMFLKYFRGIFHTFLMEF